MQTPYRVLGLVSLAVIPANVSSFSLIPDGGLSARKLDTVGTVLNAVMPGSCTTEMYYAGTRGTNEDDYPFMIKCKRSTNRMLLCFEGSAVVTLRDKSKIKINELKPGDSVLNPWKSDDRNTFGFFMHSSPNAAPFIALETEYGNELVASDQHYVYVTRSRLDQCLKPQLKESQNIIENLDELINVEHSRNERIVSMKLTERWGIYAPLTSSTDLVVNGFAVSSAAAFGDHEISVIQRVLKAMFLVERYSIVRGFFAFAKLVIPGDESIHVMARLMQGISTVVRKII